MTNHAENVERYVERLHALHEIATHTDPHLSPEGLAQWQREKVEQWRATTARIAPSAPTVPERSTVLGGLKPRTADDVALHAREREKVAALVDAGRTIESIIASADRVRLAAIFDGLETADDVLASGQGDAVIAERTAAIFDRLAEVDDDARKVADAEGCCRAGAGVGCGLRRRRRAGRRGRRSEDGSLSCGRVRV